MSHTRITVLCITVAMTALVANSTVGYLTGREPAIFFGLAYAVLIAGWLVCAVAWILAEREYRLELRDRADDYRMALRITRWRLADHDSGTWRRPPLT